MHNAPLTIGTIKLRNNLVMAPMAGITDLPFRELAREGGAGLVCTEMISARALAYRDEKTLAMIKFSDKERPVSVQLFGSDPCVMADAAVIAQDLGADIIDINLGCPVRKIVKSGAGVKLTEDDKNMTAVMENVVKKVSVPVTIKIRIGLLEEENTAPQIIALAAACGISAVTVHGRPASVHHKGRPDLAAVATAVASSRLPVIGNGGIIDELSAGEFLDHTGCAGLMIGRAAIGDTDLFRRLTHFFETGDALSTPPWEYKIELLKKHAKRSVEHYGERTGLLRLRKVAPFYLKGLPNAASIRNRFNRTVTLEELDSLLMEIRRSSYFEDLH